MPTEEGTFILCLPAHLSLIGSGDPYELDSYYILGSSLDLSGESFNSPPIAGAFTGTLDGNGYKIQNLTISVSTDRAGLFEELGADGLLQNLALEEVDVGSTDASGDTRVGGLVALMSNGAIKNCSLTDSDGEPDLRGSSSSSDRVGGLVGYQDRGDIIASYATVDIDGGGGLSDYAGGLVGQQRAGSIIASYATGNANVGGGHGDFVGGLVGEQSSGGSIIASYATVDIDGGGGDTDQVGGLVGRQNGGDIIASYATGSADGGSGDSDFVGGLVGYQDGGDIIASYGFGTPTGEDTDQCSCGAPPDSITDASGLNADNAGDEWSEANSPWLFSSGLAPRLGYITDASISAPDVTYTCTPALLPEGVACREPLGGQ